MSELEPSRIHKTLAGMPLHWLIGAMISDVVMVLMIKAIRHPPKFKFQLRKRHYTQHKCTTIQIAFFLQVVLYIKSMQNQLIFGAIDLQKISRLWKTI